MPGLGDDEIQQFKVWVRDTIDVPGMHRTQTVLLKNGPNVFKTASLLFCGRTPDDISKVELRLETSKRGPQGGFEKKRWWACENEEIAALRQFLAAELGESGDFNLILAGQDAQKILEYISSGELPSGFLAAMAQSIADRVAEVSDLNEVASVELVGMAVNLRRQREVTEQFRQVIEDPISSEARLHQILEDNWWLLGGNYVGKVNRRRLTVLDEFDLLLVRADNVVHVVELKRANVRDLVHPYRNHFTVGKKVNEAVNQAINYLRAIDETRAQILADFGIECRRAQATVIIGHPMHNGRDDVTEPDIREAIRTYNSHLSRVEVLTYEDVLATAQNSVKALASLVDSESSSHVEMASHHSPPLYDPDEDPF